MADQMSDAEALAYFRRQENMAGPVLKPLSDAEALRHFREQQREEMNLKWMKENEDFQVAQDNPQAASAGTNAVASLPLTIHGKLQYLLNKFGPENVKIGNGMIIVRESGDQPWMELNKSGLDWNDVAGLAGPSIEAIPSGIAGAATSAASPFIGIPMAGAVSAGANLVRQGAANLVGETLTPKERAVRAGVAGISGAVSEGVVRGIAAGANALTPTQRLIGIAAKSDKETVKEGLALRDEFGVPLSAGDITKNDDIIRLEALQRQTTGAAPIVKASDDAKAKALTEAGLRLADQVSGGAAPTAAQAGKGLALVRTELKNTFATARRTQADADYALVEKLSKTSEPIETTSAQAVLDAMIKSKSTPLKTKAGESVLKTLNDWKTSLAGVEGRMDAAEFQRSLELFRKAAGTGQGIAGELSPSETKDIAKALLGALYQDLEKAAPNNAAAQALIVARSNYAANMQKWKDADTAILQRAGLLDEKGMPAKIVREVAKGGADTTQLKNTLIVLDANAPEMAQDLRGAVLKQILSPKKGATDSADVVLSKLSNSENRAIFDALFVNDPQTATKLAAIGNLAQRMADVKGLRGAQTGPFLSAKEDLFNKIGSWMPAQLWDRYKKAVTTSEGMARLTSTPEGVDVLLGLAKADALWSKGRKVTTEFAKDSLRLMARAAELYSTEANLENPE